MGVTRAVTVARAAVVPAWCAGMTLVIAGWRASAALAAAVALAAAAYAAARWVPGWWAGLKVAVRLRRALGEAGKTVDRA